MAYHSFLLEPISCHAWNKDRTREYTRGTPEFPRISPGTVLAEHPVLGDAPGRGRAGLGLGLGKQILPWADLGAGTAHSPVSPGATAGTEPGTELPEQRPAPGHRQGRDAQGAEPGDSRPMAFPDRDPGDVGEQKALSLLRPERRAGGAGWGWIWELCTRSRPVPSYPVLSHPISPMGPHCRKGRTMGCGVQGSPFPQGQFTASGQCRTRAGGLGGDLEPRKGWVGAGWPCL